MTSFGKSLGSKPTSASNTPAGKLLGDKLTVEKPMTPSIQDESVITEAATGGGEDTPPPSDNKDGGATPCESEGKGEVNIAGNVQLMMNFILMVEYFTFYFWLVAVVTLWILSPISQA